MAIEDRAWKSGRISFPIFPTIAVIVVIAVIASYQFPKQVTTATQFALEDADIRGTQIKSSEARDVDFIVYLSPPGIKHVAAWASGKPNSEISVSYGDRVMGTLTLSPTMDPTTLHLVASPQMAIAARYVIGR